MFKPRPIWPGLKHAGEDSQDYGHVASSSKGTISLTGPSSALRSTVPSASCEAAVTGADGAAAAGPAAAAPAAAGAWRGVETGRAVRLGTREGGSSFRASRTMRRGSYWRGSRFLSSSKSGPSSSWTRAFAPVAMALTSRMRRPSCAASSGSFSGPTMTTRMSAMTMNSVVLIPMPTILPGTKGAGTVLKD